MNYSTICKFLRINSATGSLEHKIRTGRPRKMAAREVSPQGFKDGNLHHWWA